MFKKAMSQFLIILFVFSILSSLSIVSADDKIFTITEDKGITIPAASYSDSYSKNSGQVSIVSSGKCLSYNITDWVEYKIVATQKADYSISVSAGTPSKTGVKLDVYLNGEFISSGQIAGTAGFNTPGNNEFFSITLLPGEHTIRFTNKTGGNHFFSFTLKRKYGDKTIAKEEGSFKTTVLPTVIEAENFDLGETGSKSIFSERRGSGSNYRKDSNITINIDTTTNKRSILLFKDEYVKYTFDVSYDGNYGLFVAAKSEGKAEIYFDNYKNPVIINTTGENVEGETYVSDIFLEEGTYTITLKVCDEVMVFDYIRFMSSLNYGISLDDLNKSEEQKVDALETKSAYNDIFKEIYVSSDGDDSSMGTYDAPFKTLKRAKEEIASCNENMTGDIIVYICGEYYELPETEVFSAEHSGKNGYNVIIRGQNRLSPPIVHGGKKVTGWQKHNDILWRAPAPEGITDIRQLYVDGFPAVRAQSKYTYKVVELVDDPETPENPDGFKVSTDNFPETLTNPEDMECLWSIEWFGFITPVKDIIYEERSATFLMDQPCFGMNDLNVEKMNVSSGSYFYMENAPELLDEPGEFYFNKKDGYIYYYPYKADDLINKDVFVGKTEVLLDIKGNSISDKVENIIIDNLDIRYSVWDYITEYGLKGTQADALIEVKNSSRAQFMPPAQIKVNYADNIKIVNNSFSCHGSMVIGMKDGVTNSTIDGNVFKDTSGGAISIGTWEHNTMDKGALICRNIDVTNNVIRRVSNEQRNSVPISVYYEADINILHNDIEDVPYSGISAGWGWGTTKPATIWGNFNISNNRIVDIMSTLRDGSHIYTLGGSRESVISGNYTADSGYVISGVYNDQGSYYYKIFDNVIECGETDYWWMQGIDGTGNLDAYDNHIVAGSVRVAEEANNTEKNTTKHEDKVWSGKALEIINNAGVKKEYKNLLALSQLPEGKKSILEAIPTDYYTPVNERAAAEGTIEAEDFMFGGEGIGYHKITPISPPNNTYRPLTDEVSLLKPKSLRTYVIDNNFHGEWLQYEVEIDKTDEYYFDVVTSQKWGEDSVQPAMNVYIDGELVFAQVPIPYSVQWGSFDNTNLGKFNFTEGKHIIRVEILNNGFYFDAFRIHQDDPDIVKVELFGNEPEYDEGRIVYEEE